VAPRRSWAARSGVCLVWSGDADEITKEWYAGTMELLTEDQIAAELATVPAWTRTGSEISRTAERADFRDALLYVSAVGYLAERAGHHPDIAISWNKVTFTLSTHSAGGLTSNDFALAREISAL
jgi:4a-hydroxytetrahydrobiopterin dehydratase